MDQGFRAVGLAVPSDFSSAAVQRFGIRVAEFELDMLTVALELSIVLRLMLSSDRPRAQPQ